MAIQRIEGFLGQQLPPLIGQKVREMQSVCTLGACQTIKEAAESNCDEQMLHILRGVSNDLIAAEAKYHKSCFASYVSKSNLKHQTFREKDGESLYHEAFQGLAESISDGIARGRAYDMVSLLSMYKGLLANKGINASSYTTQHLKKRLQHRFTTSIMFHQPSDKSKPELVYSSQISVQDVINAAVTKPTTPEAATSLAMEVVTKSEEYGTVIPSNISSMSFIQLAADNNDFNEETLDGKNTTHATTMVVYQRKPLGPEPPPNVAADHSQRRRSYKVQGHAYEIQEFSAHGRRPAVTSLLELNMDEWFKETSEIYTLAKNMDFVWKGLLSVNQSEVSPHAPDDIHTIPVVPAGVLSTQCCFQTFHSQRQSVIAP